MTDYSRYGFHEDDLIFSEHPDPAWARRNWMSLDGVWDLQHGGIHKKIRVPFPIGSALSGVDFRDSGTFVYRRGFALPNHAKDKRYILRIGASDYTTIAKVNGIEVGRHSGGYASFSFDITDAAKAGENTLALEVSDSHSCFQPRGKQTFMRNPFFVWYSGISGIWQPVWIEETGPRYLEKAETRVDFAARRVEVTAFANPAAAEAAENTPLPSPEAAWILSIEIRSPGGTGKVFKTIAPEGNGLFRCDIGFDDIDAHRWSQAEPNLHAMSLRLMRGDTVSDAVETYFGIREISVGKDGIRINGKGVFLKMALVQGYYPGGNYAPESFKRMEDDILSLKALGYNGARIHEKVESPYFSYLCDRLGLMTSFEMPSFYLPSKKAFARYENELKELLDRDSIHPSCVMRMLFNETWGVWGMYGKKTKTRRFVLAMCDLAKRMDPTRPVIDNSGWEHLKTDIADFHHYLRNASLAREVYKGIGKGEEEILFGFSLRRMLAFYFRNQVSTKTRPLFLEKAGAKENIPLFLSEYGGFGWYHTDKKDAVVESIEEYTRDIVASGLFCGYCYTQLYDVGAEVNGLMTFDRAFKVDVDRVRIANGGNKR
ncbi:MAG: glycoside hydrolase family 2 protein [Spirochaetales bacterium]